MHKRQFYKKTIYAFCLLLFFSIPTLAQTTTGEITGVVTDGNDNPLPGVVVLIRGDRMQGERSEVTSNEGTYRFPLVPRGKYDLTFTMAGFKTVTLTGVAVNIGAKSNLKTKLVPASVKETITVTAENPLVDSSTTDSRFELDADTLEQIPTLSRSIEDVVKLTPGVTGVRMNSVTGGEGGLPNIRGGGQEGNQYVIDGLSSRGSMGFDNVVPQNFDSIDSLEIISDPFSPEYGKAMGGAINVVTKSGGNEFFGEAGYQYRDDSLEADREPVQASNTTTGFDRNKLWANVGGYIIKDKLWFFLSYNKDEPTNESAGAPPRIISASDLVNADGSPYGSDYTVYNFLDGTRETTNDQLFYKFTYNINPNHNIAFSGTNIDRDMVNTTGHEDLWSSSKTEGSRYRLNYNAILGDIGSLEVKYGVQKNDYTSGGYKDKSIAQRLISTIAWNYGNRSRYDEQVEEREDLAAKFVGFFDTDSLGSHEVSIGFEVEEFKTDWTMGNTGYGEDIFDDTFNEGVRFVFDYATTEDGQIVMDANGQPILIPSSMKEKRNSYNNNKVKGNGFFIQDRVTLNNWTVMLGVRADKSTIYDDTGKQIWSWDYSNFFSPRVSVIYDIFDDEKHIVKAAYGIFKDTATTRIAEFFNRNGGNAYREYNWLGGENPSEAELHNPDNWELIHEQSSESTPMDFDPDIEPNENKRYLLEYNYQYSPKHAFTTRYTNVKSRDLIEDIGVMTDDGYAFYLANYEDKKRDFESLDLIFSGRVKNFFDYTFSYTWTDSKGTNPGNFENETLNNPGGSGNYVGVFGDHIHSDGSDLGDYLDFLTDGLGGRGHGDEGWYGKLSDSVDHAVNFVGNFNLPWDIKVATALQWIDGYFYTKKDFQAIYQGFFVFTEGRGSRKTPSTYWLDLSATKSLKIKDRHEITFRLDVFNVTDQQEAISMVEENTVDFNKIYARQNPQALQLGIHYKF
ncbi:MAG: hypothetical protein CSA81_10745 [Acidobacteria bacterium]|nr:MAG: hypothetical protein CSA81_10745 [Acidobacteriota bacterium]